MTPGPGSPQPRFIPGPELLATLVASVVLASIVLVANVAGPGPDVSTPRPSPSATVTPPPTAAPTPVVDEAIADLLRVINQRLLQQGESLTAELARNPFRVERTAAAIGELAATARLGADAAPQLGISVEDGGLGDRLGDLYTRLDAAAAVALDPAADAEAYRAGATRIVELLAELPALQDELEALTGGPVDPGATGGIPTPVAGGGEQLVNGGFEDGIRPPWQLYLDPAAAASLEADPALPAEGSVAARIVINAQTAARSAISLRQGGLTLMAGSRYVIEFSVRSAADREVRLRVASRVGAAYLTRIATASSAWARHSLTFTAPASDDDAVLEVDLGRSTATVWIDAVSFRSEIAP